MSSTRNALAALVLLACSAPLAAQNASLTGGAYTQDFNTLANTAGTTTNTALPTGWQILETGTAARVNQQYAVDTGSGNAGDVYSYGSAGSSDRALGSLRSGTLVPLYGACFTNSTGTTITAMSVAYTGEQWRLGTINRTDRIDFQYSVDASAIGNGTWTDVDALDFTTPTTATVGAKDGNAAANRTARSAEISGLSIAAGGSFCIRWQDFDAASSDDGLAIDDVSLTPNAVGGLPALSINDVSLAEGDSGTTSMAFTVSLSAPAGPGGVSFDIATADGTATSPGDYLARSLVGQVIPQGQTSASFAVQIVGDTVMEPEESFLVNVGNVTGANVADGTGVGTIIDDDITVTPIAQVQGSGLTSPLAGQMVVTEGIVTALKFNNGFFLQTADAEADADPLTSEGIFVFTSAAPPAAAAVGNRVRVSGTVSEFTPGTNLNQLSITQIVSPTVTAMSTGNALPVAVVPDPALMAAGSAPGAMERHEGMRLSLPALWVVQGSEGNITESSATASTTGVFQGVLPEVERPFREPGIGVLDVVPIPPGKNPPRFDTNAERLMVRSRGQVGASALAVDAETAVTGLVGVLDYFGGTWALLPDASAPIGVSSGKNPTAVSDPAVDDITVGAFNLLRFYDEVNDRNGGVTLTAAALDKRLTKTATAICDWLKAPDILGVVEVEHLRVLGLLADRINSTCPRAPAYVPYLEQGNDPGGINVGFLVSARAVAAGASRVEVTSVVQYGKDTLFNNPDGSQSLLNDRPPLVLRGVVRQGNGASYPLTVVVNHLRSLNGIDDTGAGGSGWPTDGDRVRTKRGLQAAYLAELVDSFQKAAPGEKIVLVGDFNAFEFNDGYVDVMGIVRGNPVPESEVLTHFASPLERQLVDGSELVADAGERYSYVFNGSAQTLDHVLVNEALLLDAGVSDVVVEHARINADFGVHHFATAGSPLRTSDHDPVRLSISVPAFRFADLRVEASVSAMNVPAGSTATYRVLASNTGPSDVVPILSLVLNAPLAINVIEPAGWTCTDPVQDEVAQTTTVRCTAAVFAAGSIAEVVVEVPVTTATGDRALTLAASVDAEASDPVPGNNSATAQVFVGRLADLELSWSAPMPGGRYASYSDSLTLRNRGPDASPAAKVRIDVVPQATTVVTMIAPSGWTCARIAIYTHECNNTRGVASGSTHLFTVNQRDSRSHSTRNPYRSTAEASGPLPDPDLSNNSAVIVNP